MLFGVGNGRLNIFYLTKIVGIEVRDRRVLDCVQALDGATVCGRVISLPDDEFHS